MCRPSRAFFGLSRHFTRLNAMFNLNGDWDAGWAVDWTPSKPSDGIEIVPVYTSRSMMGTTATKAGTGLGRHRFAQSVAYGDLAPSDPAVIGAAYEAQADPVSRFK
jgi:hypothetical protein